MRVNAVLATALYSSAALLGQVRADDTDDAAESSSTSIEETSTTSAIEKPTFTVRCLHSKQCNGLGHSVREHLLKPHSLPTLKQTSSNNSQTTGSHGGNLPTQRKKTPRLPKNGHTSASGPLRSPMFSRPLSKIRV